MHWRGRSGALLVKASALTQHRHDLGELAQSHPGIIGRLGVGRLPPQEACNALIDAALAGGGHDNASLGVFSVGAQAETKTGTEPTTRRIKLPIEQGR